MKTKFSLIAILVFGLVVAADSHAVVLVYDLAADWSDTSNPNPPWAYGTQSATGTFTAFPIHTNTYINVGPPAFSGDQPAWANQEITGDNGSPEGLAKSLGMSLFDFPLGRIGGHTPQNGQLAIQWMAPQTGSVSLAGAVWTWRDIGRRQALGLFINGVPLFDDVAIPTRQSGTTSTKPFLLSDAIVADGGSLTQLVDIPVDAGDTITLISRSLDTADFAGVDFTVRLNPIPEPIPAAMLWIGFLALMAFVCWRVLSWLKVRRA